MPNQPPLVALVALDAPKRTKPSNYPEPFATQMQGRESVCWACVRASRRARVPDTGCSIKIRSGLSSTRTGRPTESDELLGNALVTSFLLLSTRCVIIAPRVYPKLQMQRYPNPF